MELEEDAQTGVPFHLHFDKPLASQIKLAEWNPEKDLLAMVTEDSKILLHRFNWQRLWTISADTRVTSLCWRPDGKVLAVGSSTGLVSLHDVENGKLMKTIKLRTSSEVASLAWEQHFKENPTSYEDRTIRFFPPAPRTPRISAVACADISAINDACDSYRELLNSSFQRFTVLCAAQNDGVLSFFIFGIFPAATFEVPRAPVYKIKFAKCLSRLVVVCSESCLVIDTSIFERRRSEIHQAAQQALHIKDLSEVIRVSVSVMRKQWSEAVQVFHDRFRSLSSLIADHGLESSPEEELLSFLCGGRTSPALHQFLVSSLGEAGLKRVSKVLSSAGKELQRIVIEHVQPAAEVIGFRLGELRGLSRWGARFNGVGLEETVLDLAVEECGMMTVQIERFMEVLSSSEYLFSNFFAWLLRCMKQLMQEPLDQLSPHNDELVVLFLKSLYNQDPVTHLLSEDDREVEVDSKIMKRVKEMVQFGGFVDCEYLRRTFAKEYLELRTCVKEVFEMPLTGISKQVKCLDSFPLFPLPASLSKTISSSISLAHTIPISISFFEEGDESVDYICFEILRNCICVLRRVAVGKSDIEAVILRVPEGSECADLSLYKDSQLVLLLNEISSSSGRIVCLPLKELQFACVARASFVEWASLLLKDQVILEEMDTNKGSIIPHFVVSPLAVSASRGLASVYTSRKRVLVYILDENEDCLDDED